MESVPTRPETLVRRRELPMKDALVGRELARVLAHQVRGEVRFDEGTRALYATAASNYRQVPIGVVVPREVDDVVATLAACRRFGVPVLSRGGGTSLAGQTTNVAVVLDFSKYLHHIESVDVEGRFAMVQPGVVLDQLRHRAEEEGLTFGPDPATHSRCTLGGMIGNNSCGVHSVMAGCTAQNVESLEVLTYDGARFEVGATDAAAFDAIVRRGGRQADLYRRLRDFRDQHAEAIRTGFPDIPRRVSGYNLPALLPENGFHVARALVGSEGTLVTVLRAKVRLVPNPRARALMVLGYPSVFDAADHIPDIIASGPIGLEGLDNVLVDDMKKKDIHPRGVKLLPDGHGWLLVEFGGDSKEDALDQARRLATQARRWKGGPQVKLLDDPAQAALAWKVRESGLGATARVPGARDTWEGWEDASVPPARLGGYLRDFRALLERYDFKAALYGHFGQGCVHTRIPFDLRSPGGVAQYRAFVEQAADLVVRYGGSLSGEHGDGQSRAELLPKMFKPELIRAFEAFKDLWDPANRMNPGKVVRAYRLDENLRLGPSYRPPTPATHFRFPHDRGSFARATERCVGVGECRRTDGGTMCPSYMVTREEAHSTRGRAHLLFEMLRGGVTEGWRSEPVKDALDLCLSCKGCKSDCPVNVDVATYKAEFLSHYYQGRLRPRSAYAFGWIFRWARLGALAPGLANWALRSPLTAPLFKLLAGVDARRDLPTFAPTTFKAWWRTRPVRNHDRPWVCLWADTFNNHWQPAVLAAAVEVLESAGFRVWVPRASLCCGRPLYDYGMLDTAKRLLRKVMRQLEPALRAGVPLVGLEPSCVSVFRDELVNLFPDDPVAQALSRQAFTLDELLKERAPEWQPPRLERKAVLHGHCHQKSVLSVDAERSLAEKMGVDLEVLDSGCCGMAGAFGYEEERYAVSIAAGERVLLPAVRRAAPDTLVVSDGFSCREQIKQETGREALHFAQLLLMAKEQGPHGPTGDLPERSYVTVRLPRRRAPALMVAGGAAAVALALYWAMRRR